MTSEWLLKTDSAGVDCHVLYHLVANARAPCKRLAMPQYLGANVKDKLAIQTSIRFQVPSGDVRNKSMALGLSGSFEPRHQRVCKTYPSLLCIEERWMDNAE